VRQGAGIAGPFLVVAPVSTLGHWERELRSVPSLNCVVYTGTKEDRETAVNYEFFCHHPGGPEQHAKPQQQAGQVQRECWWQSRALATSANTATPSRQCAPWGPSLGH